ncbi:MAG: hemerythrin domain-containing protein [bacterium]
MEELWKIEFTDDLLTGINEVDDAHRQLAQSANDLYEMCINIDTKKNDLLDYMEKVQDVLCAHFDKEIALFESYNLDDCQAHKQIHEKFKESVLNLVTKPSPVLVKGMMLNQLINHYLKDHFLKEDKECIIKIRKINSDRLKDNLN